jgi:hypothetical protein
MPIDYPLRDYRPIDKHVLKFLKIYFNYIAVVVVDFLFFFCLASFFKLKSSK